MANPIKPQDLKCKIINIEQDPKHPSRMIVSLQIDDGQGEPYIRAYSLLPPDRPISLEEFAVQIADKDLSRPTKPFHYLQEAQDAGTEFTITPSQG
jgi:ferredoxin-NADP reductase